MHLGNIILPEIKSIVINNKFCVTSFLSILKIVFETLLFEENKFKKFNSLFKGIIDGIRMVYDER